MTSPSPSADLPGEAAPDTGTPRQAAPDAGTPRQAVRDAGTGTGTPSLAATVDRLRRRLDDVQAAAADRALLDIATGVLTERLRCAPAQARAQLTELAARAGVPVHELAADIIGQGARDLIAHVATGDIDGPHRADDEEDEAEGDTNRVPDGEADPYPDEHPAKADPHHTEHPSEAVRLRRAETTVHGADAHAAARSFLDHALAPLGATAVLLWALTDDGSLSLRGHAGLAPYEAARWHHVPPGVATAARRALEAAAAVWIPSISDHSLASPGVSGYPGARAALPAALGGRTHGVLEICWPHALLEQPPRSQGQFRALAELAAHALRTDPEDRTDADAHAAHTPGAAQLMRFADGLHDPALVLEPNRAADGSLLDFRITHANVPFTESAELGRPRITGSLLLEAFPSAAEPGGLAGHAARVHATGEPYVRTQPPSPEASVQPADFGITRWGDALLVTWRPADLAEHRTELLRHAEHLGRIGIFEEDARTGETTWNAQMFQLHGLPDTAAPIALADLAAHAHPDDAVAIGRFTRAVLHYHRPAATAFRLRGSDAAGTARQLRVVAEPMLGPDGRLLAVRGVQQDISTQHWTEVALAATRDRLHLTEQQAAERNRLTWQLQHAIMPPETTPLDTPGLEVAVRYRPAASDAAVGGDWYDAVVLPGKQILVCVGDVAGHGIGAATSMVVLRNALRGLAFTGAGPGRLIGWLNAVVHALPGQVTATVVCGLYDPETRDFRWARAGHLPPILVRGGEAGALPMPDGILLGALSDATYAEHHVHLEPDDILLMYTDGLIERRGRPLHETQARLLANARHPAPTLDDRLAHLLTHSNADTDDDTCIVAIRAT
ncbi:SpoIIE family protein phosphatase [Yinghuangia soli]|uniref:SpoIIE family protein phosphatase n=1 Tax=Yinghuangia soli TaxID=2908204 RepID=A0AA41U451_9ACTN|nr:SpoIIE family protein phosphatase [Yinghuangia soli]MCF2532500.1 SpoIIE family protein phosphatase [Yinghuangia soli]